MLTDCLWCEIDEMGNDKLDRTTHTQLLIYCEQILEVE